MKRNAVLDKVGLRFFGEISSSISHEIKNSLAIVNENAGLLEDLTILADTGCDLEPERLKTLAVKIKSQIQRINDIIQRMNRFAHSAEDSLKKIDLNEMVVFVIALSERFAFIRGIVLNHEAVESDENILSNPFLLENLIWCCLEIAMDAAGDNKTVTIVSESHDKGGRIRFTDLEELEDYHSEIDKSEIFKDLINSLNAELNFDIGGKQIILSIKRMLA